MGTPDIFLYVLTMAGVTYLIRMLPMVLFRKKLKNRFLLSFLYYIPYAVLGAMTFPAVFFATGNVLCAAAGVAVALVLAFLEKGLLTVAVCACAATFLCGLLPNLL